MEQMFELPLIEDGEDKTSDFKNRIRKNYKHARKWAKRTHTDCFRLYDRDIKEYPLIIDFYANRYCVQYFSFDRLSDEPQSRLKEQTYDALLSLFDAKPDQIYEKTRIRRTKTQQYEKRGEEREYFTVREYGAFFSVNLGDYLDTGLFLDHRETRRLVASLSQGKRVLNLFAYTCAFSVHAALAGAVFTKSVDISNTYTAWGCENFRLNGLSLTNHEIVRADCLKFIDEEIEKGVKYDIIVIDPPTLSRSKKMDQIFDLQIDYISLIKKALKLLDSHGVIFFSSNARTFSFEGAHFPSCSIQEISAKTIPFDFHNQKIHRCWILKNLV